MGLNLSRSSLPYFHLPIYILELHYFFNLKKKLWQSQEKFAILEVERGMDSRNDSVSFYSSIQFCVFPSHAPFPHCIYCIIGFPFHFSVQCICGLIKGTRENCVENISLFCPFHLAYIPYKRPQISMKIMQILTWYPLLWWTDS